MKQKLPSVFVRAENLCIKLLLFESYKECGNEVTFTQYTKVRKYSNGCSVFVFNKKTSIQTYRRHIWRFIYKSCRDNVLGKGIFIKSLPMETNIRKKYRT